MELTIENLFNRYENSRQRWILPIPVLEDGQLKIICFMNHNKEDRTCDTFDSYYTYATELIVLHNFLLEKSCGSAYWKYVRCKEPRTDFLGLTDSQRDIIITREAINQIMIKGHTKYILELINKKFDDINHTFTTEPKKDDDDIKNDEQMLKDMGYDY